jgi:hypothetical protein
MSEAPVSASEPEKPIRCAGFRFHSDGIGELVPFCRECSEREFGFG